MDPILKYPGAKWSLAKWIVSHLPPHSTYLEPFFGSGAVFFNKPPSKVETINDLDGNVVNLFRVIRERPDELATMAQFTPWAREEYLTSYERTGDDIEDARRFLVRCWQAFGTVTGRTTGWRSDCGVRSISVAHQWAKVPGLVLEVAERLRTVQIECQPALKVIQRYSYPSVCIYADPPYPLETRAGRMYVKEMTNKEHADLLNALDSHPGPVLLSGYGCQLYDERLKHWTRLTAKAQAERGQIREEVLWLNPAATEKQDGLFTNLEGVGA